MSKKYFGTDGIRGRVNNGNINGEMFFKFGLAAGTYFKNLKKTKQTAIIAKDTRLSGYTLEPALVSGLASAGMHVYTLGPLPTNGLAMLTKKMKANMGIMITASHNPYYDNGLKLFGPDLYPAPFAQSMAIFIPFKLKFFGKLFFKILIYLSLASSNLLTLPRISGFDKFLFILDSISFSIFFSILSDNLSPSGPNNFSPLS